jgi:teichuronic acid biosynthesis glycosyltransferase TuaH
MLDVSSRFGLVGARDGAAQDVVFTFSYVTWQAAAQRGWFMPEDRLARMLVANRRVRRVLVCDLMRSLPVKLLRDLTTRETVPFPAGERAQQLRPVRLRRHDPSSQAGVQRAVAAYARAMRRAAAHMELRDPVLITAHPLLAGLLDCDWARAVTFYATDDWSAYPPHRHWWPAYRESFTRVAERGRRVVAVSQPVLDRLAPTGPSTVIPNGLEPAEWIGDPAPPGWVGALRRPLLLYAGSLDARLDVPGLVAIARALPAATVLLVGPLLDAQHLLPLRALPNIEIRPALSRAAVTGLIRIADVGLIPHVRSPLTEAMSPLKLYEYLAGGLPVVATDLAPMRGVDPRVTLVADPERYADAVRDALEAGRAGEDERLTFVNTNSWAARHERLLDLALA